MKIKEKIRKYLRYKGINNSEFGRIVGVSDKYLASDGNISSNVVVSIRNKFPDINMNWLLYNEGEMLLSKTNESNEHKENYNIKCKECELLEKELAHAKELSQAKDITIVSLQRALDIIDGKMGSSKAS